MAGLLTCPFLSLPIVMTVAWISGNVCGLTAAGTVPVFHRIPFSIARSEGTSNHLDGCKDIENIINLFNKEKLLNYRLPCELFVFLRA